MYDPIDEEPAEETVRKSAAQEAKDLIKPLKRGGLISRACSRSVRRNLRKLFRKVRARRIPVAGVDDETYWEHLQELWGFRHVDESKRVTPMNAANLCPIPTLLIESIGELRASYNLNVSQQKRMVDPKTGKPGLRLAQLRRARRRIARGLHLDDSADLAIVRNASEGNNLINCGYRNWRRTADPGQRENVVIWDQNHPTNREAWWLRAQWDARDDLSNHDKMLFDIREVSFQTDASDQEIADSFIGQIDRRTRFVTFTETSNGNGFRIPEGVVKQIWNHVQSQRLDCHIHIDATMTWGARQMNLRQPYCHSLVSSAHKWFLGPKETGILYMSQDKVKNFMPSIFAYDEKITVPEPWTRMPATAQRFAMLGQRDDVNIIHLQVAQKMWDLLDRRKPYERVRYLGERLKQLLTKHNWDLVTPESMDRSWGVVRVKAPRRDRPANLYNWLYAGENKYRIAGSGGDADFRLCPHIYNTMADVERAVEGMNAWRRTTKAG